MSEDVKAGIDKALRRIPSGLFVLTAEHEDRRIGTLVSLVQRVCDKPPMVSVAVGKGRPIMPLISESRRFGICQVAIDDRVMRRKFAEDPDPGDDPFLGMQLRATTMTRIPILIQSLSYLECELVRHMDVEGDHDLFIGEIKAGGTRDGQPFLHCIEDLPQTPPIPPTAPAPPPDAASDHA